jgi:hypothetical protein
LAVVPAHSEGVTTDADEPVSFWLLNGVLQQIDRSLRQLERAQAAHRAAWAERQRVIPVNAGPVRPPQSLVDLDTDFNDAMVFAISAIRQALRARALLEARGLQPPPVTQSGAIVELRNLEEHWDRWKILDPTPGVVWDERHLETDMGQRWASKTGARPWGSMSAGVGPDGLEQVHTYSSLELQSIRADLKRLRDFVTPLELAAYEYGMLDAASAAELVGEAMWARIWGNIAHARGRDEVLRWQRAKVIAVAEVFEAFDREGPASLPGIEAGQ